MTDSTSGQELFDLWKRQLDESALIWSRFLAQSPAAPPDPMGVWRPLMEQWVQAWARVFTQTPMTPDVMTQWKQFLDQSIEAWSKALGQAMQTEAFATLFGRYLDQWLAAAGPAKKATEQSVTTALEALNLATRSQLTGVAKQVVEVDDRIERVEDELAALRRRLDDLVRLLERRGAEHEAATRER